MDDSATIVGIAQTTEGAFHACLWERGIAHDLGTLGGRRSEAFAIGASRQTVGEAQLREGGYRAFLHTPATGMVALLGEIAHAYSSARAISTASHIVGHYSRQGRGGGMRGFVWREGLLLDLPAPTGYDSAGADAVNADGLIVGNTWNVGQTTQDSRAVFWDATGGHFLQDLLDEAHGWHLLTASSVNDIGEIVGLGKYGADYRGYLLRPRPS